MEMKVDVGISLENKKVTGTVNVTNTDWNTDPLGAVLEALRSQHNLELSKFYDDKNIIVSSGDIIGRLDMVDMTDTIDVDAIRTACAWMEIDITDAGIQAEDSEDTTDILKRMRRVFPVLDEYATCPVCLMPEPVYALIIHLNDHHEYTRHEIADFLEGLDVSLEINR